MRLVDVTLALGAGTPFFPGDPPISVSSWTSLESGAEFSVSAVCLGSHAGTHVDAPAHVLRDGLGAGELPLDILCGPAVVLDALPGPGQMQRLLRAVAELPAGCLRLLLRTRAVLSGEARSIETPFGLDLAAAQMLIDRGLRLIGIDRLSIAAGDSTLPVHLLLLQHEMIIVEGLDLEAAAPGECGLLCLPLKLPGADGAPARAVLVYES